MRLDQLKRGLKVMVADHWECLPEGAHVVDLDEDGDAFLLCINHHRHFLMNHEEDDGELFGISLPH